MALPKMQSISIDILYGSSVGKQKKYKKYKYINKNIKYNLVYILSNSGDMQHHKIAGFHPSAILVLYVISKGFLRGLQ